MKVKSICIVGGGSAGWMTAAALSKTFKGIKITLVESTKKPVGVGESTLAYFKHYLNLLEITDKEWMKYCNATYKTSIAFKNFRENKGERFHYPFGETVKNEKSYLFHYLKYLYPNQYPPEEGARFFNYQTILAESGKFIDKNDIIKAYHFDASLFGEYLKTNIALPNKVSHFIEDVTHATKDIDGNITSIHSKSNKTFKADLFIDCTGFKSLLLGDFMGGEFQSFKDFLFNDFAITAHIPYINKEKQLTTWTDCVALNNGWVWEIPLWNRIGSGYVFSSQYISIDEAKNEFKQHISDTYSKEISENVKFKVIKIKHGKYKKAWDRNVVGIGLSYGFIEPLESTGLLTTHENILKLVDVLEQRNGLITQMDIDEFNINIDDMMSTMMIFVAQHYYMSSRQDTQYWIDCTSNKNFYEKIDPKWEKGLNEEIKPFLRKGKNEWWDFNNNIAGALYIALGQGLSPFSLRDFNTYKNDLRFKEEINKIHLEWVKNKSQLYNNLNSLPSHYQYLKDNIYNV